MFLHALLRHARAGVLALVLAGCGREDDPAGGAGDRVAPGPASAVPEGLLAGPVPGSLLLPVPSDTSIRQAAMLASVQRGRAILAATRDSLPEHVGNDLRCTSCHLDDGRRANAMPWVGVYGRFPQYRSREAVVFRLEDRINGCLRRSMNGAALPLEHPAMRDMVAYMSFISRGVAVGGTVPGQGLPPLDTTLVADGTRGEALYAARCATCHGADGEGTTAAPPVWGDRSFNVGAGLSRLRTAAAFIRHNMPYDQPGSLTDQQAFDVAAWMITRPRPDFAGKELDWPNGDAPPDAAYRTLGAERAAASRRE